MRLDKKRNIVINDPKGELYKKFYYPARMRGFQVIAFNLINPSRTDIYNPLLYAVDAARKGNIQVVASTIQDIGDTFFPTDKADDPMWPSAANAAFQRSAFGLIDYYYEEEQEMLARATREKWSQSKIDIQLDELWGHVTLYNVYQMMTELAAKKSSDPDIIAVTPDEIKAANSPDQQAAQAGQPPQEKDYLTLFFDATNALPEDHLRVQAIAQDNSLRAMAGSDKTIASVYGISLTSLKFFSDPTISAFTSGRPSQNFDIVGMAFPRRFEFHINNKFARRHALRQQRYKWTVYKDENFTQPLGKEFEYSNIITDKSWLRYKTKGIFPQETVYLKLTIINSEIKMAMREYYFAFTKGYQKSLDGRIFVEDPITHKQIVHDGNIEEIQLKRIPLPGKGQYQTKWVRQASVMPVAAKRLTRQKMGELYHEQRKIFDQINVHYSEQPRIVFTITPPHLASYAKIVLIMLNQMFNMQVADSYMTNVSQKPDYETYNLLDEVGNLKSEGSGIPDLQVKESIGLGQGQYYSATSCIVKSYAA